MRPWNARIDAGGGMGSPCCNLMKFCIYDDVECLLTCPRFPADEPQPNRVEQSRGEVDLVEREEWTKGRYYGDGRRIDGLQVVMWSYGLQVFTFQRTLDVGRSMMSVSSI